MAKKELRKLNRAELLELLVAQTERADRLTAELQEAKEQIRAREDLLRQAGELAEAASRLIRMLESENIRVTDGSQIHRYDSNIKPAAAENAWEKASAASGYTWADAVKAVNRKKGTKHETNGLDISTIMAITSGIGKGKI